MSDNEPTLPLPAVPGGGLRRPEATAPAESPASRPMWLPDPWDPLQQRYWDGRAWTGHTAPAQRSAALQPYQPPAAPYVHHSPQSTHLYGAPTTVVMNDANPNGIHVTIAWVFTVLTLGYMLPWAIAATRGKSNALAIGLLNFLLGWTFLGWLAALVMACGSHQSYAVVR